MSFKEYFEKFDLPKPENFDLPKTTPKHINKTIKSLKSKKVTGPDKIPPKLVKLQLTLFTLIYVAF